MAADLLVTTVPYIDALCCVCSTRLHQPRILVSRFIAGSAYIRDASDRDRPLYVCPTCNCNSKRPHEYPANEMARAAVRHVQQTGNFYPQWFERYWQGGYAGWKNSSNGQAAMQSAERACDASIGEPSPVDGEVRPPASPTKCRNRPRGAI